MKPTEQQLNDPQWWSESVASGLNYCYTTGKNWTGCEELAGTFEFGTAQGELPDGKALYISEECWVFYCERPEFYGNNEKHDAVMAAATTDNEWPEGATHKIENYYLKWVDGIEHQFIDGNWCASESPWSLDVYLNRSGSFKIIERPTKDPKFIPEAGDECGYTIGEGNAWNSGRLRFLERVAVIEGKSGIQRCYEADTVKFRPIKSERDLQAERFAKVLQKDDQEVTGQCNKDVSYFMSGGYALYDKGARFNDE